MLTTLLGVTNSIAYVASFARNTCIKGASYEGTSTENTCIRGICIEATSTGIAGSVD